MTLIVLGLDALDAAQVENFDVDEFRLDVHGEMETFAHQNPIPHTGEVWPSVATGLHPREHGITHGGESEWDNPVVELASRAVGPYISMHTRARIGRMIRAATGADWEIAETDEPTFFDGEARYVHNWPGTVNGNVVREVWRHINHTVDKGDPQEAFDRELWGTAAEKFGWVREMLDHNPVLVASHLHVLDASGHAYGTNEEHYRGFYEKAARYVAEIREAMDEDDDLLILSDHGMNTSWLEVDYELRHHSWRAYSASTLDSRPKSVFDVKDWIEEHVAPHVRQYESTQTELDLPEEKLRDLGYIQ
jgi:hypothetical protein